ncbi:MAG: tRNA (adenosine(37)-N6)-threonylcarbamoyltransferase complex dimerization subunit type 1 TsaB [Candidatus Omnitrophica bacterium]|nr:tRNA (adenosine(37)-N6)-threonylcarbamoyltransferase complex dimerization subunit type 1 TsaB [Candidatus Omnitrophota bacterium]
MKTLAFDTSTKFLTIALFDGDRVVSEYHRDEGVRHSEILVPTVKQCLNEADWTLSEIGLIALGVGPGSFTGLRVGVATVKAFATANKNMKIAAVPTMDGIARRYEPGAGTRLGVALLDARKGKVYACLYDYSGGAPVNRSGCLLVELDKYLSELKDETVFFGDAVEKNGDIFKKYPLAKVVKDLDWYPRAVDIGRLGIALAKDGKTVTPGELDPIYLHARDCNVVMREAR